MNTDSFVVLVKASDIFEDITEDIETRFETSNYELDISFPKEQNKKVIGLMKDELDGESMTTFVG